MLGETVFAKGSEMGRKISMLVISVLITLFFLAMSVYQLWMAFSNLEVGDTAYMATQIAGWISLTLFFIGIWCTVLILRSDASHL